MRKMTRSLAISFALTLAMGGAALIAGGPAYADEGPQASAESAATMADADTSAETEAAGATVREAETASPAARHSGEDWSGEDWPGQSGRWRITNSEWSEEDEKGWQEFIRRLGYADCWTMDECLKSDANPYRHTDTSDYSFWADCADMIYGLRSYYAWKNGLPFSFQTGMEVVGDTPYDLRYSYFGNKITDRYSVPATRNGTNYYPIYDRVRDYTSTAMFRVAAGEDVGGGWSDFYSPVINRDTIVPGVLVYDTRGHAMMVYDVKDDGTILMFAAQPHQTISRNEFDRNVERTKPDISSGFQAWRPVKLEGATELDDGTLVGGETVGVPNEDLETFSMEQYLGNADNPEKDYRDARFVLDGREMDFYYFVRARMMEGDLVLDPVVRPDDLRGGEGLSAVR